MERKFFILVPVYKAEKFIDACIGSVLAQTWSNFRLILVNDGSPDRSGEICDAYAEKDSRISVIHKENGGQTSARSAAICRMLEEAKPEDFAVFLDSDDTLKPHCLETIQQAIHAHNCDMVVYGIDRVYEGKTLSAYNPKKEFTGVVTEKRELFRIVLLSSEYNSMCRKAVALELVKRAGETDYAAYHYIRREEDLLQSLVLYEHCEKAVFLPDSLYCYRDNPNSVTNRAAADNYKIDSAVRREVGALLIRNPVFTRQDMDDYLSHCSKRIYDMLVRIETFQTTNEKKISLYREFMEDACFREILETAPVQKPALGLLRQGKYTQLLAFLTVRNMAAKCKRFVKRMLAR